MESKKVKIVRLEGFWFEADQHISHHVPTIMLKLIIMFIIN